MYFSTLLYDLAAGAVVTILYIGSNGSDTIDNSCILTPSDGGISTWPKTTVRLGRKIWDGDRLLFGAIKPP